MEIRSAISQISHLSPIATSGENMPQCAHWAHLSHKAELHFPPFVPRSSSRFLNQRSKTNSLAATSKPTGNIKGAIAIAQDVLPSSAAFNGAQTKIDQWHNEWVSFERKFDKIKPATLTGSVG